MSQQRLLVRAREKQSLAVLISSKKLNTMSAANFGKQEDLKIALSANQTRWGRGREWGQQLTWAGPRLHPRFRPSNEGGGRKGYLDKYNA